MQLTEPNLGSDWPSSPADHRDSSRLAISPVNCQLNSNGPRLQRSQTTTEVTSGSNWNHNSNRAQIVAVRAPQWKLYLNELLRSSRGHSWPTVTNGWIICFLFTFVWNGEIGAINVRKQRGPTDWLTVVEAAWLCLLPRRSAELSSMRSDEVWEITRAR